MKTKLIPILAAITALAAVAAFVFAQQRQSGETDSKVMPSVTPTVTTETSATPDTNSLGVDGNTYRDPSGLFTFSYSNDYTIDQENPQLVRLFKRAETARPQSEITDGVIMVFEPIALGGKTLDEWVDSRITQSVDAGTAEVVQPKTAMTYGMYRGYTFEMKGFGDAKYLLLQNSPNSEDALLVTTSVMDPQSRGYQVEVDTILKSIELLR